MDNISVWSSTTEVHRWKLRVSLQRYSCGCRTGLMVDGGGFSTGDGKFNTKSHPGDHRFDRDAS